MSIIISVYTITVYRMLLYILKLHDHQTIQMFINLSCDTKSHARETKRIGWVSKYHMFIIRFQNVSRCQHDPCGCTTYTINRLPSEYYRYGFCYPQYPAQNCIQILFDTAHPFVVNTTPL